MKQVYVQEYTKSDGTMVRSHYRNIEGVSGLLAQGNNQGALDLINQTLQTIPDEKDALAKAFAGGSLSVEDRDGYMGQLQDLQAFQQHAGTYKTLADNGLDVSESADMLQQLFGSGQPTGGAAQMYNTPITGKSKVDLKPVDDMEARLMINGGGLFYPNASNVLKNARNDLEVALNDKNAQIFRGSNSIKNNELKNVMEKAGIQPFDNGVVYKPEAEISKAMSKSNALKDYFKNNADKFGEPIEKVVIPFDKKDRDLQLGYGRVTLYNPKMVGDYGIAIAIERTDFTHWEGKGLITTLNNHGHRIQENGGFVPYYSIVPIMVKVK